MQKHCTDSRRGRLRGWCLRVGPLVVEILKNLMFYLSICFNQQRRLLYKRRFFYFKCLDPPVSLTLSLAKFWINVFVVLTFNIFWPKLLTCIAFNVKIVKPGTQPDIMQCRRYFPRLSENESFQIPLKLYWRR